MNKIEHQSQTCWRHSLVHGACLAVWIIISIPVTGYTQVTTLLSPKISVAPAVNLQLFRESDSITISVTNNAPFTVLTMNGDVVYDGLTTTLHLSAGHYFVETSGDRTQFAVLPADYSGVPFLGCEPNVANTYAGWALAQIRPGWSRAAEHWGAIQPTPTQWNWSTMDDFVDSCYQNGRKLLVTAWWRPDWLTNDDQFVSSYCEYLRQLCLRYGTKIYAIEVWNEAYTRTGNPDMPNVWIPYENSLDDVPAAYLNVLSNAYATVKSVNPGVKVFGAGWATPITQELIEKFAQLGGGQFLDGFTFHDYYLQQAPPDQQTQIVDGLRPRIDQIMQRYRWLYGNKQYVMCEGGLYGQSALGISNTATQDTQAVFPSNLSWDRGMNRAIKYVVMYRAAGVAGFTPVLLASWGSDTNNNWEIYGWEFADRGPHPKTSAFLMTGYWLNNATFVDYRVPGSNVFLYAWRTADSNSMLIAWGPEGQTVPLQTGGLPPATDIFGHSANVTALTEEPVIFRASGTDASALLSTIRSQIVGLSNLAPVFDSVPTQSAVVNQPLTFSISATDPDNDPVTLSAGGLPSGATFDATTGSFSWTPDSNSGGAVYSVTFTATDSLGANTSMTVPIAVLAGLYDGLRHHWGFDDGSGTIAVDSAGNVDGTLQSLNPLILPTWVNGLGYNAISFDGADEWVRFDSTRLGLPNNFTISVWLNPAAATGNGPYLAIQSYYQASGLRFFIQNNALVFQGQSSLGWNSSTFADHLIENGHWYHVVAVFDKSVLNVYLNGVCVGTADWGGDIVTNPDGLSAVGQESQVHFKGLINDVMIFSRTLTADQVLLLHQSQSGSLIPISPPSLAKIGAKSVSAGQTLTFVVSGSDPNGDLLTYSASNLPIGATFNLSTFTWTPTTNQIGKYSVTFTVTDGRSTDSQVAVITVREYQPPKLKPIKPKIIRAGRPVRFKLKASNAKKDQITYSIDPLPAGATFSPRTQRFVWVPSPLQEGKYNLTASVSDGYSSDSQPVSITVY